MAQPTAYCVRDARTTLVPTALAQGPWGRTMSGHVVGGMLARAVERAVGDSGFQPTRLTVDLVRPTALEPTEVTTSIHREGRRIRLVDATMVQGGNVVARASALFLRRGEQPPDRVWSSTIRMPPVPAEPSPSTGPMFIHSYGWGAAGAEGVVRPTEWLDGTPGQKYAWVRHITPILDGEPLTPLVRAAMAGDLASAVAHWDGREIKYINADYTLSLSRLPDGPYIGMAALTQSAHEGVATGTVVVFDTRGEIGTGVANALANPSWKAPSWAAATEPVP
jgi:Acyl-CoA thioesterase N-terminal domain/Acyl-CoA thioesterase C-terminal domain